MSNVMQKQIHEGNSLNRDYIAMTLPPLVMAFFFYGPRVLVLAVIAVITAKISDRVAARLRARPYDKTENSSVTFALIIVLLMPASIRFRVVVVAVVVAVLVAKEAFGGYRSYPFNPAAVGFCVSVVSWPEEIFRYPQPQVWLLNQQADWQTLLRLWNFEGQNLVDGASSVMRTGGLPNIDVWKLLLGNYAGPLGGTACLVLVSCGLFLWLKKRLPLAAPLAFLITCTLVAYLFPRISDISWTALPWEHVLRRLEVVKFEILSGGFVFMAIFFVDEPGTLPRNTLSRIIYGALLGLVTMMFRYFGSYALSSCFAFLLVNAVSGYFDRAIARQAAKRKEVAPL